MKVGRWRKVLQWICKGFPNSTPKRSNEDTPIPEEDEEADFDALTEEELEALVEEWREQCQLMINCGFVLTMEEWEAWDVNSLRVYAEEKQTHDAAVRGHLAMLIASELRGGELAENAMYEAADDATQDVILRGQVQRRAAKQQAIANTVVG